MKINKNIIIAILSILIILLVGVVVYQYRNNSNNFLLEQNGEVPKKLDIYDIERISVQEISNFEASKFRYEFNQQHKDTLIITGEDKAERKNRFSQFLKELNQPNSECKIGTNFGATIQLIQRTPRYFTFSYKHVAKNSQFCYFTVHIDYFKLGDHSDKYCLSLKDVYVTNNFAKFDFQKNSGFFYQYYKCILDRVI